MPRTTLRRDTLIDIEIHAGLKTDDVSVVSTDGAGSDSQTLETDRAVRIAQLGALVGNALRSWHNLVRPTASPDLMVSSSCIMDALSARHDLELESLENDKRSLDTLLEQERRQIAKCDLIQGSLECKIQALARVNEEDAAAQAVEVEYEKLKRSEADLRYDKECSAHEKTKSSLRVLQSSHDTHCKRIHLENGILAKEIGRQETRHAREKPSTCLTATLPNEIFERREIHPPSTSTACPEVESVAGHSLASIFTALGGESCAVSKPEKDLARQMLASGCKVDHTPGCANQPTVETIPQHHSFTTSNFSTELPAENLAPSEGHFPMFNALGRGTATTTVQAKRMLLVLAGRNISSEPPNRVVTCVCTCFNLYRSEPCRAPSTLVMCLFRRYVYT